MYLVIKNIKNYKFISIILLLSFYVSSIGFSIALILNQSNRDYVIKDYLGFPGKNKLVSMVIQSEDDLNSTISIIEKDFVNSDVYVDNLVMYNKNLGYSTIAVNIKNNYNWTPNVVKGEFFNKSDLNSVVLGKDLKINKDINFDKNVRQIGTVVRDNPNLICSFIYVPLQSMPQEIKDNILSKRMLTLTIVNRNENINLEINKFSKDINSNLSENIHVKQEKINYNDDINMYNYIYFSKFIITSLVSSISMVLFLIYKRQKQIAIKKSIGARNVNIIFEFFMEIFSVGLCSIILSSIILILFSNNIHKYFCTYENNPLTPFVICGNLMMLLCVCLFTTFILAAHVFNIYPIKYLKS